MKDYQIIILDENTGRQTDSCLVSLKLKNKLITTGQCCHIKSEPNE